jgi:tripartite-type tricarboxylate transporter receptor subunit TctC
VAGLIRVPLVLVVNPSVPATTVPEPIAYAKAHPGNGSAAHIAGELFKMMAGVDVLHVPYSGNPLPDLLGGQVQVMFSPMPIESDPLTSKRIRSF